VPKPPTYGHLATPPKRIGELEDKLKQAEARIKELKVERDDAQELIDELRINIEEGNETFEQWKECFNMQLDDDGTWKWSAGLVAQLADVDNLVTRHTELVRKWNQLVPRYNAVINPKDIGRPLAASDAQRARVLQLRKAGHPLRAIAAETGLGFRTVRTIIDKPAGKDRTSKAKGLMRRRELDKARMATWRARKRQRDALPKRITEHGRKTAELIKAAKGAAKLRE
jgi:hypothetical protein